MTNKKVFELFDFICGVSTGAILVCGLAANNNLTLTEGINLYKKISYQVFHRPSTFDFLSGTSRLMWNHAYYDTDLWEKLLQHHMTNTRIIDTAKYSHCPKVWKYINLNTFFNIFIFVCNHFSSVVSRRQFLMKL